MELASAGNTSLQAGRSAAGAGAASYVSNRQGQALWGWRRREGFGGTGSRERLPGTVRLLPAHACGLRPVVSTQVLLQLSGFVSIVNCPVVFSFSWHGLLRWRHAGAAAVAKQVRCTASRVRTAAVAAWWKAATAWMSAGPQQAGWHRQQQLCLPATLTWFDR